MARGLLRPPAMQPRAFHPPVVRSSAEDPEQAFDVESFDFITYLSRRLGVDRELTTEVLGHWLTHYEPADSIDSAKNSPALESEPPRAPAAAAPSGVFPVTLDPALRPTGTNL
jgi:hypothetical protein